VVVPVSLSFVRAPAQAGYPESNGPKTVDNVAVVHDMTRKTVHYVIHSSILHSFLASDNYKIICSIYFQIYF